MVEQSVPSKFSTINISVSLNTAMKMRQFQSFQSIETAYIQLITIQTCTEHEMEQQISVQVARAVNMLSKSK